jgi:endonuclease/exonuclease/phosphatase family metal-dependent hydrolase
MILRAGTYNVNNLFRRARLFQEPGFSKKSAPVLKDISRLCTLIDRKVYTPAIKSEMIAILTKYQFDQRPSPNPWFTINEVRNKLVTIKKTGAIEIAADGRADWVGSVDLKEEVVPEESTWNTGRVIKAIGVDVLCLVEIEDRQAITEFNKGILQELKTDFGHNMSIEGNDDRGIDVGIYSRWPITSIQSHIDDTYTDKAGKQQRVFSRDCPVFQIEYRKGKFLYMICNHFKSKGYGDQGSSDRKRTKQAEQVAEILKQFDLSSDLVIIAGDLNDTPKSGALKPLMKVKGLTDVLSLQSGPRNTYISGNDQIDYLLISRPLKDAFRKCGVERRGWSKKGVASFKEVTSKATQASDHAAVWAEFEL